MQACYCGFAVVPRQQGQASFETLILAAALVLLVSVPVSDNGQHVFALMNELSSRWLSFQQLMWDTILLLPWVLK